MYIQEIKPVGELSQPVCSVSPETSAHVFHTFPQDTAITRCMLTEKVNFH